MSARNETREPAQQTQRPAAENPTAQHIETAGGAHVAGHVSAGRDFVGRDQITDNRVVVHGDATDAAIITGGQNTVQNTVQQMGAVSCEP